MANQREEYLKAKNERDYERMAELIKEGLPMTVLKDVREFSTSFRTAIDLAKEFNNTILVEALLSRTDILDTVRRELFNEGLSSLKILQYLEDQGIDIGKICLESPHDVMCELLCKYRCTCYGDERCEEFLKIIDFLKSRGVETVRAYNFLAADALEEEDRHDCLNFDENCHDEVAKRLKPKGGKQWKLRG